jgi:hypothetical protein
MCVREKNGKRRRDGRCPLRRICTAMEMLLPLVLLRDRDRVPLRVRVHVRVRQGEVQHQRVASPTRGRCLHLPVSLP